MLYLHFCSACTRIHVLSGHRLYCPACDGKVCELSLSYNSYIKLSRNERDALVNQCSKPELLQQMRIKQYPRYKRK